MCVVCIRFYSQFASPKSLLMPAPHTVFVVCMRNRKFKGEGCLRFTLKQIGQRNSKFRNSAIWIVLLSSERQAACEIISIFNKTLMRWVILKPIFHQQNQNRQYIGVTRAIHNGSCFATWPSILVRCSGLFIFCILFAQNNDYADYFKQK